MADQSDRNCIAPARQGMTGKPYKSWQQGISLRGCRARWFPFSRQCGEWSQKDYLESLPVVQSCYRRGQAISDSISRLTSRFIARESVFRPDVTDEEHTTAHRFVRILCLYNRLSGGLLA